MGRRLAALLLTTAVVTTACSSSETSGTTHTTTSPAPAPVPADWTTYHGDPLRTGNRPGLPPVTRLAPAWTAHLDGAVYAQPLAVHGRIIAATENDSLYALDPATGAVVWHRNVGTPMPLSALPCGDVDPLGITGTPVYDPSTGLVFAVAEVGGGHHVLVGVDAATGALKSSRPVDPPLGDVIAHQQRGALALSDGHVLITFGGLSGDCGRYVGTVLGVPVAGPGPTLTYTVPTANQGGIWTPGGPVVDGDRIFVSVGNGADPTPGAAFDGSDAVVALTPELTRADVFAPSTWVDDNTNDLDLGSMTPARIGAYILISGKRGVAYTVPADRLGGVGGQTAELPLCPAYGAAAVDGDVAYLPCDNHLQQVTVDAAGGIHPGWTSPANGGGSPVTGGGVVWAVDTTGGTLSALDPATGAVRFSASLGSVPHFVSPMVAAGRVFVGTSTGIRAFATD